MTQIIETLTADVIIAGGGLAGLVTAYDLLGKGKKIILFEKSKSEALGGLAKESFGGVHMIGTPHQKRMKITDSPELAYRDWESYANFSERDHWPREWAKLYCERSRDLIFDFLDHKKIQFLPLVNWPERGVFHPGNSVPRWHITWGTGYEIIDRLVKALRAHPGYADLQVFFEHEVSGLDVQAGRVQGVYGRDLKTGREFRARAENTVIASGGICGGDLSKVRANWYKPWGKPPEVLLNGAHDFGDGMLHDRVSEVGGNLTHLDRQWHYAAGIHHPAKRRPADGLSLVPPRSALWLNAKGERIGPVPLVGYTDTRFLVECILKEPGQYSWQVMNRKIALKELAVSGCDYMTAFRQKSKLKLVMSVLFGNRELVDRLIRECPDDIVVAENLTDLMDQMDHRSLFGLKINRKKMQEDIHEYDAQIDRGEAYFNDDQLRRLVNFRLNRGDRIRMCKNQKIVDPSAGPLIAIREFILARKSLGGIQTNLKGQVLRSDGSGVEGLYAVGEAAGFGGGGVHGQGALEGTFLGGCVLTGRMAARALVSG